MTSGASHTIGQVRRSHKVLVAFAGLVAREAPLAGLLCVQRGKSNDLCRIAAGIDVGFPRTVASFASLPLRALMLAHFCLPVRTAIVAVSFWLVTRLTSVSADV